MYRRIRLVFGFLPSSHQKCGIFALTFDCHLPDQRQQRVLSGLAKECLDRGPIPCPDWTIQPHFSRIDPTLQPHVWPVNKQWIGNARHPHGQVGRWRRGHQGAYHVLTTSRQLQKPYELNSHVLRKNSRFLLHQRHLSTHIIRLFFGHFSIKLKENKLKE